MNSSDKELSPESGSSHEQSNKKRRLAGACDACRKRKTKCDSSQMPGQRCSHCQTANVKCTHDMPRQPTKAEMTSAYIQSLEEKVAKTDKMYALLQKVYPGQDIDQLLNVFPDTVPNGNDDSNLLVNRTTPTHLSYPIPRISGDITVSKSIHEPNNDEEETAEADDFSHIALAKHFDQLQVSSESFEERFFGPGSTFQFVKHCFDVKAEFTGLKPDGSKFRRPTFWDPRPWEVEYACSRMPSYVYPDEPLLHSLTMLYFERVNSFLPLLHKPTFLDMLAARQHLWDLSFGATVLMVCALGSRYSQDPRVLEPGDKTGLSGGWQFFRQVPLHPDSFLSVPTLYDLQYYSLVHVYLLSTSVPHVAWNILGLAMQCALGRGIHRRTGTSQKPSKDEELKKRAFWCLILLDRLSSSFVGRPCVLADEDFDLDYPVECDDEYWETGDPDQDFKQPPGKPCTISSFVYTLKLIEILAFAHRTLYTTKKSKILSGLIEEGWELRVVAQLDSSMNQWKDSLPTHLRWDAEQDDFENFHRSVLLQVAYSYIQIQIHRPFLTKKSPLSFASLAICTNAARSCAHVMEVALSRGLKVTPLLITGALTSGLIITLNLWGSIRSGLIRDPVKEMEDLQSCRNVLKEAEQRWHVAGRAYDLLNAVSFIAEDYHGTHKKRQRDSSSDSQTQPSQHLSSSRQGLESRTMGDYSAPSRTAISDWDMLGQIGYAPPDTAAAKADLPETSNQQSTAAGISLPVGQDEQIAMDLFSLWSDIPTAFSLDEWDLYLANLEKSSYP